MPFRLVEAYRGSADSWWRRAAVASILLPVLLFSVSATISWKTSLDSTRQRLERTIDILYEHATKVFETQQLAASEVNQIVFGLTDAEIVAREPELHDSLRTIAGRLDQVLDIWVVNARGHPLVTAKFEPVDKSLDLSDRTYFNVHRSGAVPPGAVYISEVMSGRLDPGQIFYQASIKRRSGTDGFAGIVAISVDPNYFSRFYEQVAKADDLSTLTLSLADGAILSRYPALAEPGARLPPTAEFYKAIAKAPERGYFSGESSFEQAERFVAYRKLQGYPVYVTIGVDRGVIVAQWMRGMVSHLVFGAPATILLCLLTFTAYTRARREEAAWARFRAESQRREALEEQLRQSQKMEAIGRLTGGIAHDFNNLLTIVGGSLDMLSRRLPDTAPREKRMVSTALDGVERAARLTNRLLAFSRRQPLDARALDANQLVIAISDLLRSTTGGSIVLETVLAPGIWPIFADASQLENALLNLAANARDAMPEGGRIRIETANVVLDGDSALREPELAPGHYVLLSVEDTGVGMTPEIVSKVFEPFFTTKPKGAGTGLGLSQVFGFVKQSGGHVRVVSSPGDGTRVRIFFPRDDSTAAEEIRPALAGPIGAPRGDEAIVVVEDEPEVRRFTVDALRELGYRAIEAHDGPHALALLTASPEVRLLLTDVVMPGMDGPKLAREATHRHPDIAVLFMTGYAGTALETDGSFDAGIHVMPKPFSVDQLSRKVREVIDEKRRMLAG